MNQIAIPIRKKFRHWGDMHGNPIVCDRFLYEHIGVPVDVTKGIFYIIEDDKGNIEIEESGVIEMDWKFVGLVHWEPMYDSLAIILGKYFPAKCRVSVYMEYEL